MLGFIKIALGIATFISCGISSMAAIFGSAAHGVDPEKGKIAVIIVLLCVLAAIASYIIGYNKLNNTSDNTWLGWCLIIAAPLIPALGIAIMLAIIKLR